MKKLVSFVTFVLCLSLASGAYAGGWGHGGGGYYGGHGGYGHGGGGYYGGHGGYYGHGGGYYGGHGYNSWAVGINLGGYPYYGYGPYWGYGYAPVYYAPAPVYYAPAPVYNAPTGHWETQQIWVPGSQRYWVDQYYDKSRDAWVLGHWEERPGGPGYWTQQQVWVAQ